MLQVPAISSCSSSSSEPPLFPRRDRNGVNDYECDYEEDDQEPSRREWPRSDPLRPEPTRSQKATSYEARVKVAGPSLAVAPLLRPRPRAPRAVVAGLRH